MTRHVDIQFSPRANTQLKEIATYVAQSSSVSRAETFINAILRECYSLENFPERGKVRPELGPNAGTITFRRRLTILYRIKDGVVIIAAIFYRGQVFR